MDLISPSFIIKFFGMLQKKNHIKILYMSLTKKIKLYILIL